jgi:hypothetical protein
MDKKQYANAGATMRQESIDSKGTGLETFVDQFAHTETLLSSKPPERGQRYLPLRMFHGPCTPLAVLGWPGIPHRAKMTFGVVAGYIRDCDFCDPELKDLAFELGISVDTVSRDLHWLERVGILCHIRTGKANQYSCCWHPRLGASLFPAYAGLRKLRSGQAYNPWKKFAFVLVPRSLVNWSEISAGAKLLFGLLALHARRGRCFASDATLAHAMAITTLEFRRYRRQLLSVGLIAHQRKCRHDPYHFIFQPVLIDSLSASATPMSTQTMPQE